MSDNTLSSGNKSSGQTNTSYKEARDLLEGRNRDSLMQLASDETSYPEMLFFLSSDDNVEIRTKVASNPSTPLQADKLLSTDAEPSVRQAIGAKVARRLPTLSSNEDNQRVAAVAILERLIEDEEVRVRRIIAEELKTTDKVPLHIIQKLARDIDGLVSRPILRHSPILEDEELISIIKDTATSSQLTAMAERKQVSEPLAECIIETADVEAISQLLLNPSAQIRENTLDQLIEGAREISEWHEPLVLRPKLPFGAIRKIADFVAGSLLDILSQRNDIDDELREDLERRVQKRLAQENPDDEDNLSETLDVIEKKLRRLHINGDLNETYLRNYTGPDNRNIIILSLAIMAKVPPVISRRIFMSLSAKAIMSLGWKAGISATLATKIQSSIGNVHAEKWILPDEEENYPFTPREMQWQLALFLDQEENEDSAEVPSLEMSIS
jgi:uncharacterized protein (DUF2336 family)